jgi:lysophospholipase L1-like esterase
MKRLILLVILSCAASQAVTLPALGATAWHGGPAVTTTEPSGKPLAAAGTPKASKPPHRPPGAVSAFPEQEISSAGPLTAIGAGADLSCQVAFAGDSSLEFYGADEDPADCGTMLSVDGQLYAPDFASHDYTATANLGSYIPFTPVSQTGVTGSGTAADPYQITTTVTAGSTGLNLLQTDSYVTGQPSFSTTVAITNSSGAAQSVILYRAGDCYVANSDSSQGSYDSATGSIACFDPATNRLEQWVPHTPGSSYLETGYSSVWSAISASAPLPDTCDCSTFQDTGAGLSWSLTVPAGQSANVSSALNFGTTKLLVAFGDSVSAGEGVGMSAGYPDNTSAFPAVLAAGLGWAADNFSISGACAGGCSQSILANELPAAESMHLQPDLVTVTVGADDIDFGDCFRAVLGIISKNPCTGPDFKKNLAALKTNLGNVLTRIKTDYPGVRIAVTEYYNPLPYAPTANVASLCSLMPVLSLVPLIRAGDYKQIARIILHHQLRAHGAQYEKQLYDTAKTVLSSLNGAINAEASQFSNVTLVPVSFFGHDFCEDYTGGKSGFVFGPSVLFTFGFTWGLLSKFIQFQISPTDLCSSNLPGCYKKIVKSGSGDHFGFKYSYTFIAGPNDFPHPTPSGQDAIANRIRRTLGL